MQYITFYFEKYTHFLFENLGGIPIWGYLLGAVSVAVIGFLGLLITPHKEIKILPTTASGSEGLAKPSRGARESLTQVKSVPQAKAAPNEVQKKRSTALRKATHAGDKLPTLADQLILSEAPSAHRKSTDIRRRAKHLNTLG